MNSTFLKILFAELLGEEYDGRSLDEVELKSVLARVAAKNLMSLEETVFLEKLAAVFARDYVPQIFPTLLEGLGLAPGSTVADALAAIEKLKSGPERMAERMRIWADELVDAAEVQGKILPSEREFLRKKALKDFGGAEEWVNRRRRWSALAISRDRSSAAKNWSSS